MATFAGNDSTSSLGVDSSKPTSREAKGDATVPLGFVTTPVIYTMRAFNTDISQYVYWNSTGIPDTSGAASGYDPGDLLGIVVVRIS